LTGFCRIRSNPWRVRPRLRGERRARASAAIVENQALRLTIRLAIWLIGGGVCGVVWLKTFKLLPFGDNDLGMGIPTLGILAGQFSLLLMILYANTYFDKWPLVYKESSRKEVAEVVESGPM